ncbi:phosphatase [Gynuella sp.]|uniref:phosphatase n=1 Tax=Gynuella sp. TaxID=2969146 RepID=UPI003D13EEC2
MKILCDTHSHTVASTHAYSTVNDYFNIAPEKGLQLISITDHGPKMPDAPHPWHFGNMKVIPRVMNNVAMLRGIEANIYDEDGQLDIADRMDAYLDFAIASFHEPVFTPGSAKQNTRAMIGAISSGKCQIIGHPGNPNYPIIYDDVVKAARDHNVLLEINNSSFNQSRVGSGPYCLKILETVVKYDWKVSFGSDAHVSYDVGNFAQCIEYARKAGLSEDAVVTARPERFLDFLEQHGKSLKVEFKDWLSGL